jgi:hypothetical protein
MLLSKPTRGQLPPWYPRVTILDENVVNVAIFSPARVSLDHENSADRRYSHG